MEVSNDKSEPPKSRVTAPLSPTFNPKRTFDFAAISNKKTQPLNLDLPTHDSSEVLNEKLDHTPLGTGLFMPSISLNDQPMSSMEYGNGHAGLRIPEKDRERWHGRHKSRRASGMAKSMAQVDYTSASAGAFSTCMFDNDDVNCDANFAFGGNLNNNTSIGKNDGSTNINTNTNNNNDNFRGGSTDQASLSPSIDNNSSKIVATVPSATAHTNTLGLTSQSRGNGSSGNRSSFTNRNSIYSPQGRILSSVTPMIAANSSGAIGSPLSSYNLTSRGNTPISASYFSRGSAKEGGSTGEGGGRTPVSIGSLKTRTPLSEYRPELSPRIPHRKRDRYGSGKGKDKSKYKHNRRNSSHQSLSHTNDNKRLVNEFLRSLAPPSSSQLNKTTGMFKSIPKRTPSKNIQAPLPIVAKQSGGQSFVSSVEQKSLQSLLFREIERTPDTPITSFSSSLQTRSMAATPMTNTSPSSPNSAFYEAASIQSNSSYDNSSSYCSDSSSSSSFDSMDLSSRDKSIEDEANNSNIAASRLALNYNEPDNYQRHMAIKLYRLKLFVKSNIKDTLLRNELALQKNIQNFDSLYSDLEVLTERLVTLQELINDQYLSDLRRDFDDTNSNSYRSTLERTLNENVRELELLEQRMSVCKKKLAEQREAVKNMDSLLILENSILSSKKDKAFIHRYGYVFYDIFILVLILLLGVFIKRTLF